MARPAAAAATAERREKVAAHIASGSHSLSQVWLLEGAAAVLGRKRCLGGGMMPLGRGCGER